MFVGKGREGKEGKGGGFVGCFGGVCVVFFCADVGFGRSAGFFGWLGFGVDGVDYLSIYLSV